MDSVCVSEGGISYQLCVDNEVIHAPSNLQGVFQCVSYEYLASQLCKDSEDMLDPLHL